MSLVTDTRTRPCGDRQKTAPGKEQERKGSFENMHEESTGGKAASKDSFERDARRSETQAKVKSGSTTSKDSAPVLVTLLSGASGHAYVPTGLPEVAFHEIRCTGARLLASLPGRIQLLWRTELLTSQLTSALVSAPTKERCVVAIVRATSELQRLRTYWDL